MEITNVNVTAGVIEIRINKYRITMIVKSCYVPAAVYCSLYQSQISYRDGFVSEEVDRSYHGTHIAFQYDIPNNPDHRLVHHKGKVHLKSIRNPKLDLKVWVIYHSVAVYAPKCGNASVASLSHPISKMSMICTSVRHSITPYINVWQLFAAVHVLTICWPLS